MTKILDNSAAARDLAHQIHGFTDLAAVNESELMVVTEGDGIYIKDDRGNRYLDCTAGMYCTALGFSERELAEAAYEQMCRLPTYHTLLATTSPPATALAEKLAEITPERLTRVFLVNSGSEANDTIVKLIWYYNNALGRPEKKKIISRMGSYHGTTVAAASLTGNATMQMGFDVPLKQFLKVDGPHMFRAMEPGEDEGAYAARLVQQVEDLILAEGPDTVAAMVVDPLASSAGFQLSPKTYFARLQAMLRRPRPTSRGSRPCCGAMTCFSWWTR
jgi:4-aminobutyrate--pyruvate transaminase